MDNTKITNWIWTPAWRPEDDQETRLVYFRKEMEGIPEPGVLHITADTRYKLYLNGSLIEIGPTKGDSTVWYVDEVPLNAHLRPGRNVLAVAVMRCSEDAWNSNHSLFRTPAAGLYVDGAGAGEWRCHVDRSVRFCAEEAGFSPLHIHEVAALDPNTKGWLEPGFDDTGWDTAQPYAYEELPPVLQPEKLLPRTIPYMKRRLHSFALPLRTIPAHSEERFVLDAGEEMCAFPKLTVSGGRGAKLRLLYSECYQIPEGDGYRKEDRTDAVHGCLTGYEDRYTVSGNTEECYEPYWFRTFRYIQIAVRTGEEPLTLHSFTYEETGYPLETKTDVQTSDPSLKGIWDISLRTLRRCMHETYVDCPFYEQLQYAMDTRSQILYTYALSADDRLARKAIDDFSRAQRPDGLLNCSYPNKNTNVIPGFSIYYILMVHDHMMYFGDKHLVRRYLPTIERILQFFHLHLTQDDLVDKIGGVNLQSPFWSFIDWAQEWLPTTGMPAAGLTGPITMESLLLVLGLQRAAELADYVGDSRSQVYRDRAKKVQRAVRQLCMDGNGMITDGPGHRAVSQHAQVFGILTGTLTPEEGRRNLLLSIEDQHIPQCTVAMCFYLFRAMEQTGLYEYTDHYWNIWRKMCSNGCTTCVESEGYARSECHAWGALALYELPSVTLGVRPGAPGYEKIEVKPVPGYLDYASGTVTTPRGDIRVAWQKEAKGIRLSVNCPDELRDAITT